MTPACSGPHGWPRERATADAAPCAAQKTLLADIRAGLVLGIGSVPDGLANGVLAGGGVGIILFVARHSNRV